MAEPISPHASHQFDRCAGHLALDFANALGSRHTDSPIEYLPTYAALVGFARQCELLPSAQLNRLEKRVALDPAAAEVARREAVELREALYRMFAALAERRAVAPADLDVLNRAVARLRVGRDLEWEWAAPDALDCLLGPIVRAALELVMSPERERIRICAASDCVWVFLDTSKNRSRRWCDMKQCGN
ncbi:MAG TPA: ABATE domain-containing protein, partial [Kofleriaceae bacterium]|nr:ABATE domain-containing protein [Kofleriaceae bacterium]